MGNVEEKLLDSDDNMDPGLCKFSYVMNSYK